MKSDTDGNRLASCVKEPRQRPETARKEKLARALKRNLQRRKQSRAHTPHQDDA